MQQRDAVLEGAVEKPPAEPNHARPDKKTAEQLVDEMFEAVWVPKARPPPEDEEDSIEDYEENASDDYGDEDDFEDSGPEDGLEVEEEFDSVETGVQQIVAGKIKSISGASGKCQDAERLERISKQIKSQLGGVNWQKNAMPSTGLRLRRRQPQPRLRKKKHRGKRTPGSANIYQRTSRTKSKSHKKTARQRARKSTALLKDPHPRAPLWAHKEAATDESEINGLVLRGGVRPTKLTAAERKIQKRRKLKQKATRNPWYQVEMKAKQAVQHQKQEKSQKLKRRRQRAEDVTQYLQSLSIEDWLQTIGREDLFPILSHEGFASVHDLMQLTENELHMLLRDHCGFNNFKERSSFHRALRACINNLLTSSEPLPLYSQDHPLRREDQGVRSIVHNATDASDSQFNLLGDSKLAAKLPPIHPGARVSKSSDTQRLVTKAPPVRARSVH